MVKIKNPLIVTQGGGKVKITTGSKLFYNSTETHLNAELLDVSAVTNMNYMFGGCAAITSLNLSDWDVSAVTNMGYMFTGCTSLTSLDLTGWDTVAVTNVTNMFANCIPLINFNAPTFYRSVSLASSSRLSHDSLMSIINNLATVSTAQTLTLGSANLAKLTTAEKQIATGKGWTLA